MGWTIAYHYSILDYMENERIHVIAFEDDASRKILSIGEFNNATTDNALEILKIAEKEVMEVNGLTLSINTDGGHNFIQIRNHHHSDSFSDRYITCWCNYGNCMKSNIDSEFIPIEIMIF